MFMFKRTLSSTAAPPRELSRVMDMSFTRVYDEYGPRILRFADVKSINHSAFM
ncbi:hypothetical protein RAB80_017250 [Fusarium oxysporum f. sp. vasinfectum]|nr:hypothetical protein RAB80_017250 [Fusarium oxysporum f. sp. vasinfectum]